MNNSAVHDKLGLQLALITSFTMKGLRASLSAWSELGDLGSEYEVDLYTFTQSDYRDVLLQRCPKSLQRRVGSLGGKVDGIEVMSFLSKEGQAISDVAGDLGGLFASSKRRVRAFTTFLPELLDSDRERRVSARDSLRFLVKLAGELNRNGHSISVIELVGGSSTDGVWPFLDSQSGVIGYSVRKLRLNESVNRLIGTLLPLSDLLWEAKIRLALESEPGPLFALDDLDSIVGFVESLGSPFSRDLWPSVGLNLDIAHWSLINRFSLSEVIAAGLMEKVFHAHISKHSKGHFGDCAIDSEVFQEAGPWIQFLEGMTVQARYPDFSGVLSLEYEACKSVDKLKTSAENLEKFLKKFKGSGTI